MSAPRPWITPILAVAGLLVAGYLTLVHYQHGALVCGLGDCALVQSSSYAELMGLPVAILGMGMYATILVLSILRNQAPERDDLLTTILFMGALAGLIYALYLTYVEIWVIDAICQWCVISALITTAIFVSEAIHVWAPQIQENE